MTPTLVETPTSRVRFGWGRGEITPPSDTYHRMWGAALHDKATGVHRPLLATVVVVEPADATAGEGRRVLIALDLCLFRPPEMDEIHAATARLARIAPEHVTFTFSHTHSSGLPSRDRAGMPGGERIAPWLDALPARLASLIHSAVERLAPTTFTYGRGVSAMGHNRDYPDAARGQYVCGYNPEAPAGLPVGVVRATDAGGSTRAILVNYPCHPTTLAWQNSLLSPDYVGALREMVESTAGAPCLFLLAPCGDVGPRDGYVGDPAVADRNGRELGYAVLAALESLPPAGHDFHFAGPVFSGATLGTWEHRPQSSERTERAAVVRHRRLAVPLRYLGGIPTVAQVTDELKQAQAQEAAALQAGEEGPARDARALSERKRRMLERLRPLPPGETYPYHAELWRMGDSVWVLLEGEPYHALQSELMARFPTTPLVFAVLANGARSSYLPERHDYGKPLYQAEIALVGPGSLERLTDVLADEIRSLVG